jgi:hypothetical protein
VDARSPLAGNILSKNLKKNEIGVIFVIVGFIVKKQNKKNPPKRIAGITPSAYSLVVIRCSLDKIAYKRQKSRKKYQRMKK